MARKAFILVQHVPQKEPENPGRKHTKGHPVPGESGKAQVNQDLSKIVGISSVFEKSVLDQPFFQTQGVKLLRVADVVKKDADGVAAARAPRSREAA
jgi:hypothetical protein